MGIAGTTTGHRGDGLVTMRVPFVDLKRPGARAAGRVRRSLRLGRSSGPPTPWGPSSAQFEEAFAHFCGCDHAVGVSSGTDAVKLALIAAGVRPGDEVIVPANTFIATAEAVSHVGATPVFVDCLESNGLMDTAAVGPAVTPRTTAVVPVHLYGQPVDMDALAEVASAHGLAVVEDACQAHGATYKGRPAGSFGVTAAFSFYPGKNLGALGDGGAVTTNDAAAAETVRLYRNHGQEDKYTHRVVGYCDRLHNLQAALLLRQAAAPRRLERGPARGRRRLRFRPGGKARGDGHASSGDMGRGRLSPVRGDGGRQGRGAASDWESEASSPGSTIRCRCTCSLPTRAGVLRGRLPRRRAQGGAHPVAAHVPGDHARAARLRGRGSGAGARLTGAGAERKGERT